MINSLAVLAGMILMPVFVVFAQGRLTHEINRVFALSYMGERCFVVVFAKRSMMSDYPELL